MTPPITPREGLEANQSPGMNERKPIKQVLFDHFYTGEPGQHEAIEAVTAILAPQQPSKAYAALRANLREAWAALAMIRETIETLGPSGAVKAAEHLDGSTFMHEADALVEGIIAIASSSRAAPAQSAWQPIETAPKDGRAFLACTGNWMTVCHWHHHQRCWATNGPAYSPYPADEQPTHWQPLHTPARGDTK